MVINIKQMTFTPKGSETPLLGPLDLQLAQGDWLCILGGNGSGKSTLLIRKAMLMLLMR